MQSALHGIDEIHGALVHHYDVYPKNMLIVHGDGDGDRERVVWIDFDVAVAFPDKESMGSQGDEYSKFEWKLVEGFGRLLVCLCLYLALLSWLDLYRVHSRV